MTTCPKCNGTHVATGDITEDGGNSFVVFRPASLRFRRFRLNNGVRLQEEAYACRDCGLAWGFVDPERLGAFLDSHCD